MFMEAPLPQSEETPAEAPAEQPAVDGASDAKGWTVFMDKAPVQLPQGQGPGSAGPMTFAKAENPAAPPAEAAPTPAGAAAPIQAADDMAAKGKTIIAGAAHMPVAQPKQAAPAGPMSFKSGAESSEGVKAPATTGAVEKVPASAPAPAGQAPKPVAQGSAAPVAKEEEGGGAKVAIAVVVVAVLVAAAYFLLM
jgi:hypothetical protein